MTIESTRSVIPLHRRPRIACADFAFPLLAHDKVLDLIAALEIEGVDIGLFEDRSHLWPSREFEKLKESASDLRAKLIDRGLLPADLYMQMGPDFVACAINHPEARQRHKAREIFLRTLEYASVLGSPHVTILPGVNFEKRESEAESWQRTQDELAWRIEQAAQHRIVFAVEAHIGSLIATPAKAIELVRAVTGLTLTLDYTHFTWCGIPDDEIDPLLCFASHLHIRGGRNGKLQASFSDNAIDYRHIVKALLALGYEGYLGIEYVWIDWQQCNQTDNLSETILFRDFLLKELGG